LSFSPTPASDMPPKRSRRDVSGQLHGAAGDRTQALSDILHDASSFQELEQERQKAEEERARLLAKARQVAANVKVVAETKMEKIKRKLQEDRAALEEENVEIKCKLQEDRAALKEENEEIKRKLQEDRAALEEEKTAMEKVHTFQTSKILLNVGGHRFETSLQTLTSVPNTCFASMFSGRFELTPDAEGAYFLDRDGRNFHYILNFLRDSAGSFKLSSDVTEEQRDELAVELEFYGLLDRMMPYHTQERIRRALLQRACREKLELLRRMACVLRRRHKHPLLHDL